MVDTVGGENPRGRFWGNEFLWPNDSWEYVFLARAFDQVGRALCGDAWSGQEAVVDWQPPLPEAYDGRTTQDEISRAQSLLLRHHEGYRTRAVAAGLVFLPIPSPEEWIEAVRLSTEDANALWPAMSRQLDVRNFLISLFEGGLIPTGVRSQAGGEIQPLHRSYWNGEWLGSRFTCCLFNPNDPFARMASITEGLWIFVKRDALAHIVADLSARRASSRSAPEPARPPQQDRDQHLSVYIRFMIDCACKWQLNPESSPKKDDLKTRLRGAWPAGLKPPSDKLLGVMATLMRSPDAQEGGARPQAKLAAPEPQRNDKPDDEDSPPIG